MVDVVATAVVVVDVVVVEVVVVEVVVDDVEPGDRLDVVVTGCVERATPSELPQPATRITRAKIIG